MSEDFDKEAERRRLREKYEQDKEDRESTERMSELLLKGATMTNRHCDTCGSPIFRYQGQTFCPNCQAEAQAAAQEPAAAQQGPAGTSQREAPSQQGSDSPQASEQTPGERPAGEQQAGQSAGQQPPQHSGQDADQRPTGQVGRPTERQSGQAGGGQPTAPQQPVPDDASLESVQASLTSTLAAFARRAAETEDPHRAREYLETARAAAETLRALPG